MPLARGSLKSKRGPNHASYRVETWLDPENLIRGIDTDYRQKFKRAVKALRLDAPHINNAVKIEETYEEMEERNCALRGTTASDVSSDDGFESLENRWAPRTRIEIQCVECEKGICQGTKRPQEPRLIMLGSGELEAYPCEC